MVFVVAWLKKTGSYRVNQSFITAMMPSRFVLWQQNEDQINHNQTAESSDTLIRRVINT